MAYRQSLAEGLRHYNPLNGDTDMNAKLKQVRAILSQPVQYTKLDNRSERDLIACINILRGDARIAREVLTKALGRDV